MATINVFECYYAGRCEYNGVERRAAQVRLVSDSECGQIKYEVTVSFFPHETEEDYRISYDAMGSRTLYEGKGRRSKKREAEYTETIESTAQEIAREMGGEIDFGKPLIEARRG